MAALCGGESGLSRTRAIMYDRDQGLSRSGDPPCISGYSHLRQPCQEDYVADQVSPPQPLGFLTEAIAPLHAELADPARGAGNPAGEKVQQAAHADDDLRAELGKVSADPKFLPGSAKGHENQIGAARADVFDDLALFISGEVAVME